VLGGACGWTGGEAEVRGKEEGIVRASKGDRSGGADGDCKRFCGEASEAVGENVGGAGELWVHCGLVVC